MEVGMFESDITLSDCHDKVKEKFSFLLLHYHSTKAPHAHNLMDMRSELHASSTLFYFILFIYLVKC
jgi:hypothetical protein